MVYLAARDRLPLARDVIRVRPSAGVTTFPSHEFYEAAEMEGKRKNNKTCKNDSKTSFIDRCPRLGRLSGRGDAALVGACQGLAQHARRCGRHRAAASSGSPVK
jgi:hypothetical protein